MNKESQSFPKMLHLIAIGSLTTMIKKYPDLGDYIAKHKIPLESWDFVITAAGCGVVLASSESYYGEHDAIRAEMKEINKGLGPAVENFFDFLNKFHKTTEPIEHSVGLWIMWNLKGGDSPEFDEIETLAPAVGSYVVHIAREIRGGMQSPEKQRESTHDHKEEKSCCGQSGCWKCLLGNCSDFKCVKHPVAKKIAIREREKQRIPQELVDAYNDEHGTGAYLEDDGMTFIVPFSRKRQ